MRSIRKTLDHELDMRNNSPAIRDEDAGAHLRSERELSRLLAEREAATQKVREGFETFLEQTFPDGYPNTDIALSEQLTLGPRGLLWSDPDYPEEQAKGMFTLIYRGGTWVARGGEKPHLWVGKTSSYSGNARFWTHIEYLIR